MLRERLLFHAGGNPFLEPFHGLLDRGAEALATYLLSLRDGQTQYDAKPIVVGEGTSARPALLPRYSTNPSWKDVPPLMASKYAESGCHIPHWM